MTDRDDNAPDAADSARGIERWWAGLTPEQREDLAPEQRQAIEETIAQIQADREDRPGRLRLLVRRHRWMSAAAIFAAGVWAGMAVGHALSSDLVSSDALTFAGLLALLFGVLWVSGRSLLRLEMGQDDDDPIEERGYVERAEHYRAATRGLKAVGALAEGDAPSVVQFHARAHVDRLTSSPDGAALPLVEYLALEGPDADVREMAAALLPVIRDLADRQKAGQVLLRPADASADPDRLLRPASSTAAGDEAVLLRAAGEGASQDDRREAGTG